MNPIHLAFHDGKELRCICGADDEGCWVMAREDADCKECLQKDKGN